jgi:hypothetical protein
MARGVNVTVAPAVETRLFPEMVEPFTAQVEVSSIRVSTEGLRVYSHLRLPVAPATRLLWVMYGVGTGTDGRDETIYRVAYYSLWTARRMEALRVTRREAVQL